MSENFLIVSMSRSGGTLTNNLLDSHPECNVFPFEYWNVCNKNEIRQPYMLLYRFLPKHIKMREVGFHQRLDDMICKIHGEGAYPKLVKLIGDRIGSVNSIPEFYGLFQDVYFSEFCDQARRSININHVANICKRSTEYVERIYGPAKHIVSLRDPRASFISYQKNHEIYRNRSYTDEELLAYCALWKDVANRFKINPEPNTYSFRYEDLVTDHKGTMEGLCKFIGISYDPCLETPTRLGLPIEANSSYDKMTEISTAPLTRWRETLGDRQRRIIEEQIGNELVELGYEL